MDQTAFTTYFSCLNPGCSVNGDRHITISSLSKQNWIDDIVEKGPLTYWTCSYCSAEHSLQVPKRESIEKALYAGTPSYRGSETHKISVLSFQSWDLSPSESAYLVGDSIKVGTFALGAGQPGRSLLKIEVQEKHGVICAHRVDEKGEKISIVPILTTGISIVTRLLTLFGSVRLTNKGLWVPYSPEECAPAKPVPDLAELLRSLKEEEI